MANLYRFGDYMSTYYYETHKLQLWFHGPVREKRSRQVLSVSSSKTLYFIFGWYLCMVWTAFSWFRWASRHLFYFKWDFPLTQLTTQTNVAYSLGALILYIFLSKGGWSPTREIIIQFIGLDAGKQWILGYNKHLHIAGIRIRLPSSSIFKPLKLKHHVHHWGPWHCFRNGEAPGCSELDSLDVGAGNTFAIIHWKTWKNKAFMVHVHPSTVKGCMCMWNTIIYSMLHVFTPFFTITQIQGNNDCTSKNGWNCLIYHTISKIYVFIWMNV